MNRIIHREAVFSSHLHIVPRFELTVEHVILFHAHEGGIGIGLGIAVAAFELTFVLFIAELPHQKVSGNLFVYLYKFFFTGGFD
jgi:hypothetical protein